MIAVFGAGAIGCWIGGVLQLGGNSVALIGRQRLVDELARDELVVSELAAPARTARDLRVTADPMVASTADITLVTVKSAQTAEAGETLARVLPPSAIVVSMQNGVRNADVLRAALPGRRVLAGMVPFNVIRRAPGVYHRGTSGTLMIEDAAGADVLLAAAARASLPLEARRDMPAVLWTKLVMNLNNAINGLCGLPLVRELAQRSYRRVLAAAQREALDLLALAKQPIARLAPIPSRWVPRVLEMPDFAFRAIARSILAIDPHARSSMQDDLDAGRPTEIDYLQGEVAALAARLGRTAPVNAALVALVRAAEAGGRRDYSGEELLATVHRS